MILPWALLTQVCDTPLLRVYVTRLHSLDEAPPLEDEGPLSDCYLLTQDAYDSRQILLELQLLGQDVSHSRRSRDADKLHVAILDNLMSEILALQFDTRCQCVVLIHWGWLRLFKPHAFEEVAKVKHLCGRRRRGVVLRFCC